MAVPPTYKLAQIEQMHMGSTVGTSAVTMVVRCSSPIVVLSSEAARA